MDIVSDNGSQRCSGATAFRPITVMVQLSRPFGPEQTDPNDYNTGRAAVRRERASLREGLVRCGPFAARFWGLFGMAAASSRQPAVVGPALIPLGDYASKPPIPLARPVIVVGSRNNCRIHLISSTVSKAHCLLVLTETGCYVADLASRTKTLVNGKPVREHDLEDGDTLQVGKFPFRFVAGRTRVTGRFPAAPAANLVNEDSPLPVPIERRVTLIGRRSTADIPLLEESVSTAHAVILERDGKRYLRDLGSRTGTFLNGRKIHQEELRPGDVIRIGETELRYQLEDATPVEEPETPEVVAAPRVRPATPVPPAAARITPPVVESAPAEETVATPVEDELPLHIEPEPPRSAPVEPPPSPSHDPSAETAIPIAVDEHDESSVIELEPSSPSAVDSSAVTEPETPETSTIAPATDVPPEREPPAVEGQTDEPGAGELSPRRGWRAAVEPAVPVEETEGPRDEGIDGPPSDEGTERQRDERAEPNETPRVVQDDRQEETTPLVDERETREPAGGETISAVEPELVEPPLQPIDLPPLRFVDEPVIEPVAASEGLAGEEGRVPGEAAAVESTERSHPPEEEPVNEPVIAETVPPLPEIDLSGFTPTPDRVVEEEEADEPPPPAALLPREEPTAGPPTEVPPTIAVLETAAEVIEPTEPEPDSALPVVESPAAERPPLEVSEPLSDSVFARQVEAFAGEGGEVVAPPPRDAEAEPTGDELAEGRAEPAPNEIPRLARDDEPIALQGPGEPRPDVVEPLAPSEPDTPSESLVPSEPDTPSESLAPVEPVASAEAVATPLDTISVEDDALLAERSSETPATAEAATSSQVEVAPLPSVDVFSWSADQAAFHVGGAITLPPAAADDVSPAGVPIGEQEPASLPAEPELPREAAGSPTPDVTPAIEPPASEQGERATPAAKKLRGSQRRRRSLRRGDSESPPAEEPLRGVVDTSRAGPSLVDVFSQVPAVDADELPAAPASEASGPAASSPQGIAEPVETPVSPKPRPAPRRVVPTFEADPAGLAMAGRPLVAGTLDAEEQAAAARLAAARRRRLRLVPLLLLAMATLIGGTVWAIYHFVPVIGRVEVSVRFRNIDGLPNESRRREFREQQRQRLASLPVRQAAIVSLAGYATPEMQVRPGFLEDPVEYDRVASGAQWVERGDWALRISRRSEDLRSDSWRLRAMGDALQQSNRTLLDDARRLRSDVERLDADISRNSTRRGELRQSIESERALGDSKRQLEMELQKLESEIDALETRWAEQSRQVTALQSELALLRTTVPPAPAADVPPEVPADGELIALQKQLEQVHEALQKHRAAGQQVATEARRSFEAAVARLQADLLDVQGMLDASPELKAYVETAQGLLEVTRRLTDDLIHRQQQYFDRLQAFKSQLEEQAQARRAEQWQGDPALRRLQEELEYAKRQFNVATANGLDAEATDAKLQIKLLEERIARRQQELGADPLAVSAILRLEEIIDFTAKAMAEDRVRQEKVFEENTRLLKQAAIARLPAEQQELARKLESRMAEINAARREFAAALSSETTQPAGNAEEIERLQQQAAEIAARVEARRKQLADATAARLTEQQEQKRQELVRQKEADLASARQQLADLQEQLSVRHRDRRDVARRVSEASLAGERLVQRQQELEEIEQLLEVWQRTRDAKQAELGACVEPLPVSDLDVQLEPGVDQRWVYATAAGGGLFILFGLLIAATIRAALHEIPVPDLPLAAIPVSSRLGRPATVEPIDKTDKDAHPATT